MTCYVVRVTDGDGHVVDRIPCHDSESAETMARAVRLNARDMSNGHTARVVEVCR